MTMQKVMDVFSEYLEQDKDVEIVLTRHGYTFLIWNSVQENWFESRICKTPQSLMNTLLGSYACYNECLLTQGMRNLTDDEKRLLAQKRNELKDRCEQD